MSVLTETAPAHIWLCVSDEEDDYNLPYPELYAEDAEITWSTDQPVAVTIEYVRNDLSEIARLRQELAAARALLRSAHGYIVALDNRITHPCNLQDGARKTWQAIDAALAAPGEGK